MQAMSPTRRRFLEFLVGVAAVHIVAIAIYYGADIAHTSARQQRVFAWVWMAATVLVVLLGLQRLKRARRQSLAARFSGRPPGPPTAS
jgi:TRAP-type C4-dicarboxylate transport system permease small subunit